MKYIIKKKAHKSTEIHANGREEGNVAPSRPFAWASVDFPIIFKVLTFWDEIRRQKKAQKSTETQLNDRKCTRNTL